MGGSGLGEGRRGVRWGLIAQGVYGEGSLSVDWILGRQVV